MPAEIEKTPTVVVVDDDELILSSMRVFLSLETDYKLMEFNDPPRAVSELKHTPVDVVISDFTVLLEGVKRLSSAWNESPLNKTFPKGGTI